MEYISTKEASKKWGISPIRITLLANEGRIPGAYRLGKSWLIPATATKPERKKANRSNSTKKEPENSEDFSKAFLRLQMLLAADFPHRDDLAIILDCLKTYVQTSKNQVSLASV